MYPEELVTYLERNINIEDCSVGIFIRHAARESILSGKDAHLAALTSEGREAAKQLGKDVSKWPLAAVYSSVIERCVDTGNCIIEGANSELDCTPNPVLATGYLDDWNVAKYEFARRDPEQIVFDYLGGETIAGFSTIPAGSKRLLDFICSHSIKGALTFFVTHDALIMPFSQFFLGTHFSHKNWTPFLGAAVVVVKDDKVFINDQLIFEEVFDEEN